jgi:hypothetical protein
MVNHYQGPFLVHDKMFFYKEFWTKQWHWEYPALPLGGSTKNNVMRIKAKTLRNGVNLTPHRQSPARSATEDPTMYPRPLQIKRPDCDVIKIQPLPSRFESLSFLLGLFRKAVISADMYNRYAQQFKRVFVKYGFWQTWTELWLWPS